MTERETALHRDIMNLRCEYVGKQPSPHRLGYREGFRDARHAAAELVAALPPGDAPPSCQWREIASAPQGTLILLCSMTATELCESYFVDWLVDGRLCSRKHTAKPTHWMPLPAPPVVLVPAEEPNHAEV